MRIALPSTRRVALVTAALLAGCSGGTERPRNDAAADAPAQEQQDPRAAICATAAAAGQAAAPPFDLIQQIFDDNCVSCHSPGADVDLSPGAAWGDLVGRPAPAAEACGGTLVVPGSPDTSYLYQKVSSAQPCSGAQMPRSEFASDPLPACVIALVGNWIAAGAPGPSQDGGGGE